jgi:hypothetical protein
MRRSNIAARHYPLSVSISMIIGAVVLSFVDLAFLNDVIGKILDLDATGSMVIAFVLGLVGIGLMAHLGAMIAHGNDKLRNVASHYALWVLLGVSLVTVRIFSASILQLDVSLGDESLLNILGQDIRQVDLVIAPLMLLLYLATGIMVKDGVRNLLLNPDFEEWREARRNDKANRKSAEEKRAEAAERQRNKLREEAEKKAAEREEAIKAGNEQNTLNNTYGSALAQFHAKEKEIKEKYKLISANIDYIKSIDKQERDFEMKVKPGLTRIVSGSIRSAQNSIALAIRKKTGEDIASLRNAIESHNAKRSE